MPRLKMSKGGMSRRDWTILSFLALFVTGILFFVSPDSFLYDLHYRVDSAIFYMCGKSWMNGLVPYVDFSDSKGPLLWLIYGLGYLIHPRSLVGVFWISCLWYTLTYFFTFKTAELFLKDTRKALVCTVLMTLAYFCPWYHHEIRSEDFCMLFMVLSLYRVCRLLYEGPVSRKETLMTFGLLGFCFGALLLIKYNIAAMQAVIIIWALVYLVREKENWLKPFLYGLAGFAAITVPFLVYFLIAGNLNAFIREYFLNTLQTIGIIDLNWTNNALIRKFQPESALVTYLMEWTDVFSDMLIAGVFTLLVLGGVLFLRKKRPYKWMPLTLSLAVFAIALRHHIFSYYFSICAFLFLFLTVELCTLFRHSLTRRPVLMAVIAALVIIPANILTREYRQLVFYDSAKQREYYKAAYVISQVKDPKLIAAYDAERGYGIPAKALPAGKYWACQAGMTPEMIREHEGLILSGKADFIIVNEESIGRYPDHIPMERLAELGYKDYLRFGESNEFVLYSNKDGLDVREYATPPVMDLFWKRYHYLK